MSGAAQGYRERELSARDGLRLYYRDYGDSLARKTPLLCLSGLTRNSKDFAVLAERLCRSRRIVCPDYRGRGRSERDPDWRNYRSRVILDDIRQLLAASNLHRAIVCGVSYGGILGMALAVMAPSLLAGVILNDIGPEVSAAGSTRIFDYIGRDQPQPDWDAAVAEGRRMFPTLSYSTDAEWRRFAEATYREGEDGQLHFDWDVSLVRPLREDRSENLWPLFFALRRLPVLVVRGGVSDVLTAEGLARMAEAKPDLAQVTLPGVGHMPSLNEPEVAQAIDDFLSRIDG